jgi:hypothetical protein
MPSAVVRKHCLSSVATLITAFQTASGSNVSTLTVFRELHEMGYRGLAAAHKPKITMPSVVCSGVKLAVITPWSIGVMNHTSLSGSLTDESGFDGCQEHGICSNA